jgi:alginate O-acetyltransferase complex protein AlgI
VLLGLTVPLYWALPWQRARLLLVFSASLVFYAWRHWPSVFLLLGTILLNFIVARRIEDTRRRGWLVFGLVANLGVLTWFKYSRFLAENVVAAAGWVGLKLEIPPLSGWLPLGVSFFTFQVMAYLVDVWRGEVRDERDVLTFAVFKSFLAQLVAGPIVKGKAMFPQLHQRRAFDPARFQRGLFLVLAGCALKLGVADAVRPFVDQVYADPASASTVEAWLALYGYAVQLFADFWGYSTVAVGVGFLFGFELPFNFELPYLADSLQQFWRHWHVTLSNWFRDYLYLPLGGNRSNEWRNRIVTMTLAGLWHGAAWTFVLWGFLHGVWMSVERALELPKRVGSKAVRVLLTFHVVSALWVLFRAPSLQVAAQVYGRLVLPPYNSRSAVPTQWPVWIVAFLLLHPGVDALVRADRFSSLSLRWQVALCAALGWLMLAYAGAPADFIYFVF